MGNVHTWGMYQTEWKDTHADTGWEVGEIISNSSHNSVSFCFAFFNSSIKQWILGFPRQFRLQTRCFTKVLGRQTKPMLQSSVMISITESTSHGSDESRPFATAIFRKEECHAAFGCQILDCLMHDSWKAMKNIQRRRLRIIPLSVHTWYIIVWFLSSTHSDILPCKRKLGKSSSWSQDFPCNPDKNEWSQLFILPAV